MRVFDTLGKKKAVLGMVHLGAMPGTPFYEEGSYDATFDKALGDATALFQGGATGCLVQTVDRVYSTKDESDPARIAGVANIVRAIAQATGPEFQIGVQIMRNALKSSLAVAKVSGGTYVRCGALVGATLTSHGMVEANPLDVMTYRKYINAMQIKMIAEIDSMHFKWLGGKPVGEIAPMARYVGADAVSLGDPNAEITLGMIREVRKSAPTMPIILCGYTNFENTSRLLAEADGAFVGTVLEKGKWGGPIDADRVRQYMEIVDKIPAQ